MTLGKEICGQVAVLLINSIDLITSHQYMLYFKNLYLLSCRFNKQLQKCLASVLGKTEEHSSNIKEWLTSGLEKVLWGFLSFMCAFSPIRKRKQSSSLWIKKKVT